MYDVVLSGREMMLIALDYDNTYDRDPDYWDAYIRLSEKFGHEFILLTYRDERYDWTHLMDHLKIRMKVPIYCTRGVAKQWWWDQFGDGRKVDVWIDDNPRAILENSKADRAWLEEWRKDDKHLQDANTAKHLNRTEVEVAA